MLDKDSTILSFCANGKVRKSMLRIFFLIKTSVMFSYWILLVVPSVRILSTFHERLLKILYLLRYFNSIILFYFIYMLNEMHTNNTSLWNVF